MPARRKRESELQRPRHRQGSDRRGQRQVSKGRANGQRWYAANPEWDKSVRNIWNAAKSSGGSEFYEQSDIALLWALLDDLNTARSGGRLSGQLLQTLYGQLNRFLLTETDRRSAGIELEAPPEEEEKPAELVAIDSYKDALKKSAGR